MIILLDDTMSTFLTDRTPNLRKAIRHVENRVPDMPVQIFAVRHDGIVPAIPKSSRLRWQDANRLTLWCQ